MLDVIKRGYNKFTTVTRTLTQQNTAVASANTGVVPPAVGTGALAQVLESEAGSQAGSPFVTPSPVNMGVFSLERMVDSPLLAVVTVAAGAGQSFRITDFQGSMLPTGLTVLDLISAARVQCGLNIPANWTTAGAITGAAVAVGGTSSITAPVGTNGRLPLLITGLRYVCTQGGAGTALVNVTGRTLEAGSNAAAIAMMTLGFALDTGLFGGWNAEMLCMLNTLDNTSFERTGAEAIVSRSYDAGAEVISVDAAYTTALANTTLTHFAPLTTNPAMHALAFISSAMEAANGGGSRPSQASNALRFLADPLVAEFVNRLIVGSPLAPLHIGVCALGRKAGLSIGRRSVY